MTSTILETARHNFEQTAVRLKLPESLVDRFLRPKERIELRLHPLLPTGRTLTIPVFIARHSDVLGPAKGGIRMTPGVTADDIAGLAMEMTWKTALIGVPFGGGKTGIACDTAGLTAEDKEVVIRSFARAARRHIGPELYVPAPDMGTNEADMGYLRDSISHSEGMAIPRGCYVTGKPVVLGGIQGRREATGRGVVYTVRAACDRLGLEVAGLRVAVQGFGNVGSVAARQLVSLGARVIAVTDIAGGLYRADGIDVDALILHSGETGGITGFAGAEVLSPEKLFELECDLLIPAASGSQITSDNARHIRARIIAEGANAPTTPDADDILNENGVFVIPDILCNAGGVFVSYLEYTQETQREQMVLSEVETRLQERMDRCFTEVHQYSEEHGSPMRAAAMDLAVTRVSQGVQARGAYP